MACAVVIAVGRTCIPQGLGAVARGIHRTFATTRPGGVLGRSVAKQESTGGTGARGR